MKIYITLLITLLTSVLYGQTLDSLGLDNNARLNKYESDYFNNEFKTQNNKFDFVDTKVAFVTGSSATKYLTKTEYFTDIKSRLKSNHEIVQAPVFLTDEEKIKSGYDVIVTIWVKVLTDQRRKKIIAELKAASR